MPSRHHHRVYVVLLRNPRGDGRDGYYVGMTGLPLDDRLANHKRGYKSASVGRKFGVRFAWELFDGIPAMSFKEAALAEPTLADDLRDLGYLVYGPTNRQPVGRKRLRTRRRLRRARKTSTR
jgi:hypothetical protein